MHPTTKDAIVDEIALNDSHFSRAPQAFFQAGQEGVELIRAVLFGNDTRARTTPCRSSYTRYEPSSLAKLGDKVAAPGAATLKFNLDSLA